MNSSVNSSLPSSVVDSSTYYQCGPELRLFYENYAKIHGWVSLLVCVFGSITNTLNIAVLTRRDMRSPTNMILSGLAVADLLVMIEYVPYTIHLYLYHRARRDTFTYGWAVFVLFHSNFTQVCHTISIWLTVTLAIWRYVAVAHPQRNHEWCSYGRTVTAIVGAYLLCPLLCFPLYITTEVRAQVEVLDEYGMQVNLSGVEHKKESYLENTRNTTLYFVRLSETARVHGILKKMNFWIYSVVIKLIPCFALTVLSIKLVLVLLEAKKRSRKLISMMPRGVKEKSLDNAASTETTKNKKRKAKSARNVEKERQTDRTTMMLLAVLLLFLLTELPQGVLGLLSVTLGSAFFRTCYLMLGDVIDILTLINSAINFILYCTMSRQFRRTFKQLFCSRWKAFPTWMPMWQHPMDNNRNNAAANCHTVTQVTQV